MSQALGELLRTLRQQRNISQAELARRAYVAVRTLRYWEASRWEPGTVELTNLLLALEVTPEQRVQALTLLTTARGVLLLRQEASLAVDIAGECPPLPSTGELLRAMRERRGLRVEQMAASLGVARTTIVRWEATESFPSEENLARSCALLNAYPEEEEALVARQLQPWGQGVHFTLEECAAHADLLDARGKGLLTPLIDLYALALKRQLWLRAQTTPEARRLLARVHVLHASWLRLQNRVPQAQTCIQQSLRLLNGPLKPEPFWQAALNLSALFISMGDNGNVRAGALIRQWLPVFPTELRATLWCDLAVYCGREGQAELAEVCLATARKVIPFSSDVQGLTECYYPLTCARVCVSADKGAEALNWIPALPEDSATVCDRATYQLLRTEALLKAGENDAAQRCMDDLARLFVAHPQPLLQRKLKELSAYL